MNLRRLQAVMTLVFLSFSVQALAQTSGIDCEPLKPVPPQNTSTEIIGKIDTNISGALKKLADPKVAIEGTYRDVTNNILKEFPNADQIYIKERTLFLYCQVIRNSQGISDSEKLDRIEKLMDIKGKTMEDKKSTPLNSIESYCKKVESLYGRFLDQEEFYTYMYGKEVEWTGFVVGVKKPLKAEVKFLIIALDIDDPKSCAATIYFYEKEMHTRLAALRLNDKVKVTGVYDGSSPFANLRGKTFKRLDD